MLVPISAIICIQRYIEINTCSISLISFLFFFSFLIILKHLDYLAQFTARLSARVQPRWIQGIQSRDGAGEERLIYLLV